MKKSILITLIISFIIPVYGQKPLDFEHRSILKKLRKYECPKDVQLREFKIPVFIDDTPEPNGKYFFVESDVCEPAASYLFVGRVNTCRSGGCVVHYDGAAGINYEYFDFYILFRDSGEVEAVKVFKYEATHGHEITAKRWLRQFEDYAGDADLQVGKDIDGISGATTSVYSITYEIQERTKRLRKYMEYYQDSISSNTKPK